MCVGSRSEETLFIWDKGKVSVKLSVKVQFRLQVKKDKRMCLKINQKLQLPFLSDFESISMPTCSQTQLHCKQKLQR